jgi:Double zinc ribbon
MTVLALFGIENDGLNLAVNLLLLFLVVLWLALIYWTYADARRRIADPMLVGCAVAASVFPFIGTIVYLIVRPPEYLEDKHERELEIAAAEARLASSGTLACPYCSFEIERSFLRCPSCLRRLKEPCAVCGKPLDPRWKICPYCEAEVGQDARRASRPRRPAARPPAAAPRAAPRAAAAGERPAPRRADGTPAREPAPPGGRPSSGSGQPADQPTRVAPERPPSPG